MMDLSTSSFDAVVSRWGMTLFANLNAGLLNIHKSLADGGTLAAVLWATSDKVPILALALNTVMKETNVILSPPGTPGPFSLSDENVLKNSFIKSGFEDVTIERMNVIFDFDSANAYTAKSNVSVLFEALLITLIFTLSILQFPSQLQHYQNAIAQRQANNDTTYAST